MSIKEQIVVEVFGRMVKVTILATGDDLVALNALVEGRLQFLKDAGTIKWYSNKINFFAAMPQNDWQPVEMLIELKKLLNI